MAWEVRVALHASSGDREWMSPGPEGDNDTGNGVVPAAVAKNKSATSPAQRTRREGDVMVVNIRPSVI